MKKFFGLTIILIISCFFLLGCIGGTDLSEIAKLDASVQQFLKEHPNAEIKVTLMNVEQIDLMADTIKIQCDINLPKTDHYYVRVNDPQTNTELYVWINASTQKASCIYRKGTIVQQIDQNEPTLPTDQNQVIPPIDQNEPTLPVDQNNIVVQPDVERVKVGNIYLSVAKITLNTSGTNVDEIKLRIDNETEVEQSISKKVSINIKNSKDELMDSSTYQNSLSKSNIKETQFTDVSAPLYQKLSPGTYVVEIGVYNQDSTTTNTYLKKEIKIGSDSDKEIIYPRKVENFTPNNSIKLGLIEMFLENIYLNSYGTNVDEIKLRFENKSETEQSISKNISALILNNKNEIMDVSTYSKELYLSNMKEVQLTTINLSLKRKLSPGQYTILIKVYNSGSSKSNLYITKQIQIGPDELQSIAYEKKIKSYNTTTGEITKIKLNSYGTNVDEYSFKIGETVLSGKNILTIIINDKNEVVDVSTYNSSINTSDIVNNLITKQYLRLNRKLPNGEYTLLVQIYNSESNVPGFVLAKKIMISPDALKEQ